MCNFNELLIFRVLPFLFHHKGSRGFELSYPESYVKGVKGDFILHHSTLAMAKE
jgi:hypothetical protein